MHNISADTSKSVAENRLNTNITLPSNKKINKTKKSGHNPLLQQYEQYGQSPIYIKNKKRGLVPQNS